MEDLDQLIKDLRSDNWSKRWQALVQLGAYPSLTEESLAVLQDTTRDDDRLISSEARRVLYSHVDSDVQINHSTTFLDSSVDNLSGEKDQFDSPRISSKVKSLVVGVAIMLLLRYYDEILSWFLSPKIVEFIRLSFFAGIGIFFPIFGILLFYNGMLDIRDGKATVTGRWARNFEFLNISTSLTGGSAVFWGFLRLIGGVIFFLFGVWLIISILTRD